MAHHAGAPIEFGRQSHIRSDINRFNVNLIVLSIQASQHFHVFAHELLGLGLVIQLVLLIS
jgi:hypothetical protein